MESTSPDPRIISTIYINAKIASLSARFEYHKARHTRMLHFSGVKETALLAEERRMEALCENIALMVRILDSMFEGKENPEATNVPDEEKQKMAKACGDEEFVQREWKEEHGRNEQKAREAILENFDEFVEEIRKAWTPDEVLEEKKGRANE